MDDSLRFDWFDTLRIDLLDDLASGVVSAIDRYKSTNNQSSEQLKTQQATDILVVRQLLSALYQAYFALPIGTLKVSIPTSSKSYSRAGGDRLPLGFSYRPVRRVLDALRNLDWIE